MSAKELKEGGYKFFFKLVLKNVDLNSSQLSHNVLWSRNVHGNSKEISVILAYLLLLFIAVASIKQ